VKLLWVLLLLVVAAVGGFVWWDLPATERPGARTLLSLVDRPSRLTEAPTVFEVLEGDSAKSVARRLQDAGLIRNAALFRLWAATLGVDGRLEAGLYELAGGLTTYELLIHFDRARAPHRTVTLVEGWRMEEIADELERLVLCRGGILARNSRRWFQPRDGQLSRSRDTFSLTRISSLSSRSRRRTWSSA
jgi:cell division protein YceG involved in septum cleavage